MILARHKPESFNIDSDGDGINDTTKQKLKVMKTVNPTVQTFVAGQTKVVAFDVLETGSSEPNVRATIKARHGRGPVQALTLDVKGIRIAREKAEKARGVPFTGAVTAPQPSYEGFGVGFFRNMCRLFGLFARRFSNNAGR